jgi:hypothetical protein
MYDLPCVLNHPRVAGILMSDLFETFLATAAQQLGEDRPDALGHLRRIVECLGSERTAEIIKLALRLEKFGGTLVADGSRKRSVGGTFFVFARGALTRRDRKYVWPVPYRPPTTNPPDDESEGSVPFETGANDLSGNTQIIAPKLKSVNMTAGRRYNEHTTTSPHQ